MNLTRFVSLVILAALTGCEAIPILVQQEAPPADPSILRNRPQSSQAKPEGDQKKDQNEDENNAGFGFII